MHGVAIKEEVRFACMLRREDRVGIVSERLCSRQEDCSADVECDEIVWETWRFVDRRRESPELELASE